MEVFIIFSIVYKKYLISTYVELNASFVEYKVYKKYLISTYVELSVVNFVSLVYKKYLISTYVEMKVQFGLKTFIRNI